MTNMSPYTPQSHRYLDTNRCTRIVVKAPFSLSRFYSGDEKPVYLDKLGNCPIPKLIMFSQSLCYPLVSSITVSSRCRLVCPGFTTVHPGSVLIHPGGVTVHPDPASVMPRCLPVLKMLANGVNRDGTGINWDATGVKRDHILKSRFAPMASWFTPVPLRLCPGLCRY